MRKQGGKTVKVVLDVPYFSQNSVSVPKEWRNSVCGIAAVKMVLDFFNKNNSEIVRLIDEGVAIDGFTKNGWTHESLVRLLRNHGITTYQQEFRSVSVQIDRIHGTTKLFGLEDKKLEKIGLEKIISKLSLNLPVIVSVSPGFNHNKHSHLILIVGFDAKKKNLYYHDPNSRHENELEFGRVSFGEFFKTWRKLAIFID